MHMNFRTIGNTLFLRDLAESNSIEELFNIGNFELKPPVDNSQINCYSPKFTRGTGIYREGYCEACEKWFKLKTSSYWYHMNYKHGINSRGIKCPEPLYREGNKNIEGYCKDCGKWIFLGNSKKNTRFSWLRHWQKTHCKKSNTK